MKQLDYLFIVWLIGFVFLSQRSTIMASNLEQITMAMPKTLAGWTKSPESAVYTPDNLYKYIDGGAELYISYGFKKVLAHKYIKEGLPEISVELFDMGSPYNAFGVFSHSREKIDRSIAPDIESEYASGLLTFWKGSYYVSIMAYPETQEKKDFVLSLGKSIAGAITEESPLPPLVSQLPKENLNKADIRYFRHYIWLNSHFFIADTNILNINEDTQAVLGKYKEGENSYVVLLVSYPEPVKAQAAGRNFLSTYLPDAKKGIKQLEDSRWTGYRLERNVIAIVFNAPTEAVVHRLLTTIFITYKGGIK